MWMRGEDGGGGVYLCFRRGNIGLFLWMENSGVLNCVFNEFFICY